MVSVSARMMLLAIGLISIGPATAAEKPPQSPGRAAAAPQTAQLSKNDVLILVRATLIALGQANQTGNYTLLRDLGSPEFQAMNTAARLGDIFKPLRAQMFDLTGVAVLEPQLSLMPQVEPNGQLHMSGVFPSVPLQIRFDMAFVGKDQRWVLNNLSVALTSSAPGPLPTLDDGRSRSH